MNRDDMETSMQLTRLEWQRQMTGFRSEDYRSKAPAGVHLGRLVSGDGRRVTVDWLDYDGSTLVNRWEQRETLPVALLATVSAQRDSGWRVNDVTTAPEAVNYEDWASVLKQSATGPEDQRLWWLTVDGDSQVQQLVQASVLP